MYRIILALIIYISFSYFFFDKKKKKKGPGRHSTHIVIKAKGLLLYV